MSVVPLLGSAYAAGKSKGEKKGRGFARKYKVLTLVERQGRDCWETARIPGLVFGIGFSREGFALARKVTFTVEPSEEHHDILTIQDAFQQAIDFFDLLTDEAEKNVLWKLEMASTNSPFTCQGEPIDARTFAGAHALVEERVDIIERNFRRIAEGMDFDETFPREKLAVAKRFLQRNTNGIGLSKAVFSDDAEAVEVSQTVAKQYFEDVAEPAESLHSYLFSRTSRREIGAVEGRITDIGSDYEYPALQLEVQNTNRRIWCRISPERAEELGTVMKAGDVWKRRRIRVHGTLNYDNDGSVLRVTNGTIDFIDVARQAAPVPQGSKSRALQYAMHQRGTVQ